MYYLEPILGSKNLWILSSDMAIIAKYIVRFRQFMCLQFEAIMYGALYVSFNIYANFLPQVPETLPQEVLSKMHAPPKSEVPHLDAKDLAEADGFLFGFPTRYGMMAAQFKSFLDATGGLWRTQSLAGKPAGIFISTASQGGGQETTA